MSKPRRILPGRTYLVSRRCRDRRFLLRPDDETNQAFYFCLISAAIEFDVGIVAFIANSNHWHGVLVDRRGNLPDFLHYFHLLLAKHQNCLRGRWENMWASEKTSIVELVNREDVVDKIAYVLANPVKDHLVERTHSWPGASAIWALRDRCRVSAKRPWRFFDKNGRLDAEVSTELCKPPTFDDVPPAEYLASIEAAVAAVELRAAEDRRKRGISILGRAAVLRQHWDDRPRSREPRRRLSPRVACRNTWARIERLAEDKAWIAEYLDVRKRWEHGDTSAIFPRGTYWLRHHAGVICEGDACDVPLRL